jgi:hypothetical protein
MYCESEVLGWPSYSASAVHKTVKICFTVGVRVTTAPSVLVLMGALSDAFTIWSLVRGSRGWSLVLQFLLLPWRTSSIV